MAGGLIAIIMGILSYAGRGDNESEKDVAFKWLSVYVRVLMPSYLLKRRAHLINKHVAAAAGARADAGLPA